MERIIPMSAKEIERANMLIQIQNKTITQIQAADILSVTTRQVRRLITHLTQSG